MMDLPPRIFGRADERVSPTWRSSADDPQVILAGDWVVLSITPGALDQRQAHVDVEGRLAAIGRQRADVLLLTDILASELKIGWPTHRMQQLRNRGLCRYLAVEAADALEAEWMTTNAPVHAVVIPYTPADMAVRYRVFDLAIEAGMALVTRAATASEAAFQLGAPQICSTILPAQLAEEIHPAPASAIESAWEIYSGAHPEPQRLRSGHPPDYGT